MTSLDSFSIVVPTRDDPERCAQLLDSLIQQGTQVGFALRVVFLVNDTGTDVTGQLEKTVSHERFSSLQPRLLRATRNHLTVEENILHTLGDNLDSVDEHFLIIGNSDRVILRALPGALDYLQSNRLELLLVGLINSEVHEGKTIRQLCLTPRHLTPKNRVQAGSSYGNDIFSDAMADYGPHGYLAFIGCQIYTKRFFRELCVVLSELPQPLYAIPVASLELTTRRPCAVGFWPNVVVVRIDHLLYGPDSADQPPHFWIPLSRTKRGLSCHCILSIIENSLHLSSTAFSTLVNSQDVCNKRASPDIIFTNLLFTFIEQMRNVVVNSQDNWKVNREWKYSPRELQDIVKFGERLDTIDIGLPAEQRASISKWLQAFNVIGDYSDPKSIRNLMSGAAPVLMLLDSRPGMDRWIATLSSSTN